MQAVATSLFAAFVVLVCMCSVSVHAQCESADNCSNCTTLSTECGWCSPMGICMNLTTNFGPVSAGSACSIQGGSMITDSTTCPANENCGSTYGNDCNACKANSTECGYCSTPGGTRCYQQEFQNMCTIRSGSSWNAVCPSATTTGSAASTTGSNTGSVSGGGSSTATTGDEFIIPGTQDNSDSPLVDVKSNKFIIGVSVAAGVVFLCLVGAACTSRRKKQQKNKGYRA